MTMFCPHTGLRVLTRAEWSQQGAANGFKSNYFIVGDSIIYGRPEGKAVLQGVRNSFVIRDDVSSNIASGTGSYIQIEDFAALTGSTQAARHHFIKGMIASTRCSELIFCNLSLPLSIAVTIGKRFNTTGRAVHVAKDYGAAIQLALERCEQERPTTNNTTVASYLRAARNGPSLIPMQLLSDDPSRIETPEFSVRSVIIDRCILHSTAEGFLETEHLPAIGRLRDWCKTALPADSSIKYIIVDATNLKGSSPLARMKYMQMSRDWHQEWPIRTYIFYGVNTFIRTVARLARPIMPFKIRIAKDLSHAFAIVENDKRRSTGEIPAKAKKRRKLETSREDIEELLAYIGSINWTTEGIDNSPNIDEQHPFFLLFQSVRLIKEEFDSLFSERRHTSEELRASNSQLQKALAELKTTQEHMVQHERLAAVGQLSAGIAHDFNNLLTSILGHADMLLVSPQLPPQVEAGLSQIVTSGQHAESLVRQLLDFSRKSIRQPEVFLLEPFIRDSVKFFERTIPENVQFLLKLELGDYWIEADRVQMQQAITNLVVNARDAMQDGGTLTIGLSRLDATGEVRCFSCDEPITGECLRISVEDSGTGIPEDVLSHVVEPFFTTKGVGKGTGLGLSQVDGIVSQHGGHISVDTRVCEGTTVSLWLPRAAAPESRPDQDVCPEVPRGQGEVVLLVEDEQRVLDVTREMLKHLGYEVKTAADGVQALAVYRRHSAEIDLVLSDMVMPGMAGDELYQTLRAENPGVKMVMMSGYPLNEKGADLLAKGVVAWVEKPLQIDTLSQIVNAALSATSEGSA